MWRAVARPIFVPKKWLTIRSDMSIPAETPADVKIGVCKVNRTFLRILALGAASRRKWNARQWVVASYPSSNPALPISDEPVHTEAVSLVLVARSAIQFSRLVFFISVRVPQPPGTTSKSRSGQSSKQTSGLNCRPPIAEILPGPSETNRTRNGDDSSCLRRSSKRVTENTSKGPATSNTWTWLKMRIPTVMFWFFTNGNFVRLSYY